MPCHHAKDLSEFNIPLIEEILIGFSDLLDFFVQDAFVGPKLKLCAHSI